MRAGLFRGWFLGGIGTGLACLACTLAIDTSGFVGDADANGSDGAARDSSPDGSVNFPNTCDAAFCDDFDDGPLGARWSRQSVVGDASMALVPSERSLPNALGFAANDEGEAWIERDLTTDRHLVCSFDLAVDQ